MARLSRTRARRHHSGRADQHRLVVGAARRAVAPADRAGLVIFRGPRRPPLHSGAARRRRDRRVLQGVHRRAGVEASRRGQVLGVEWRRRSARDTDPQQRSRLYIRCDRNPERARRVDRPRRVVAKRDVRHWEAPSKLGLRQLAPGGRRHRHRRRRWHAGRLRSHHWQAAMDRSLLRWKLQLTTPGDDRRRGPDPPAGRTRCD